MKNLSATQRAAALNSIITESDCESIETDATTLQIYPHTETSFHYFMAFVTIFVIMPLGWLVCPLLIPVKLILYTPISIFFDKRIFGRTLTGVFTKIKNSILILFHYYVYKVNYIYSTIWLACLHKQDDHWYGVDLSPYSDYENYVTSFRTSKVRWRFKKKLRTYEEFGVKETVVPDHLVFFKMLFSRGIFSLVKEACTRKNQERVKRTGIYTFIVRDYFLLLYLPVRLHVYEKDGKIIGLASYIKRGNTLIMCQHIIADGFSRSGLFYNQMNTCFSYAFDDPQIRYVSCAMTTGQSKQTCGCHPINYLLTDEFKLKPFSPF